MKLSPSLRRILIVLDRYGDLDYEGISEHAHVASATLTGGGYMLKLHILELVRVSGWIRQESSGRPLPVWSVTPGESKPKPKPLTNAQKCRRYKQRAGYGTPEYVAHRQAVASLNALLNITTSQKGL